MWWIYLLLLIASGLGVPLFTLLFFIGGSNRRFPAMVHAFVCAIIVGWAIFGWAEDRAAVVDYPLLSSNMIFVLGAFAALAATISTIMNLRVVEHPALFVSIVNAGVYVMMLSHGANQDAALTTVFLAIGVSIGTSLAIVLFQVRGLLLSVPAGVLLVSSTTLVVIGYYLNMVGYDQVLVELMIASGLFLNFFVLGAYNLWTICAPAPGRKGHHHAHTEGTVVVAIERALAPKPNKRV